MMKGEITRKTVKHVGFIEAKLNLFYIRMNLLCKGFRHNAEQERSYRVPTWRERALQLRDD